MNEWETVEASLRDAHLGYAKLFCLLERVQEEYDIPPDVLDQWGEEWERDGIFIQPVGVTDALRTLRERYEGTCKWKFDADQWLTACGKTVPLVKCLGLFTPYFPQCPGCGKSIEASDDDTD